MSVWKYRIHMYMPAGARDSASSDWVQQFPGGSAEAQTFTIPLSQTGTGNPTHYGASMQADEDFRAKAQAILQNKAGARWVIQNVDTQSVIANNIPGGNAIQWNWDFYQCAAAAGLQVILPPGPS